MKVPASASPGRLGQPQTWPSPFPSLFAHDRVDVTRSPHRRGIAAPVFRERGQSFLNVLGLVLGSIDYQLVMRTRLAFPHDEQDVIG